MITEVLAVIITEKLTLDLVAFGCKFSLGDLSVSFPVVQ